MLRKCCFFVVHLKEFIRDLQNRGLPTLLVADDDDDLIRDQFNVRKLLVVATETGKVCHMIRNTNSDIFFLRQLYGLDSNTGDVVWQRFIPNIAPLSDGTLSLHVLRTASHPPLPPLSVAIGVSKVTQLPWLPLFVSKLFRCRMSRFVRESR